MMEKILNFEVPDAKAKDIDAFFAGTHKTVPLHNTISTITPSEKFRCSMRKKLMAHPNFEDGGGPIAKKRTAVDWSDIVKPSIGYEIQTNPGMFAHQVTES